MPTYIAMLKWTPQGLQNIKNGPPSRLDAARKGFEATGVKMKEFYIGYGPVRHDCRSGCCGRRCSSQSDPGRNIARAYHVRELAARLPKTSIDRSSPDWPERRILRTPVKDEGGPGHGGARWEWSSRTIPLKAPRPTVGIECKPRGVSASAE